MAHHAHRTHTRAPRPLRRAARIPWPLGIYCLATAAGCAYIIDLLCRATG